MNTDHTVSDVPAVEPEPPGCLPGIVAATLLMGIVAFLLCGVTTWVLFQKRTEFAIRTLQGHTLVVEQSLLEPKDKADVIEQLKATIQTMSVPDYPPADAAATMQRLVRLPIAQWGEVAAIESFIERTMPEAERDVGLKQLSRMRRAVEIDRATVIDVNDALTPITTPDLKSPLGRTLNQPLTESAVRQVIDRAELVGDRGDVPDQRFPITPMAKILRDRLAEPPS